MQKTITFFRNLLCAFAISTAFSSTANAVTFTVHSQGTSTAKTTGGPAGGYSIMVTVTPVAIVAPASCPWGYNYEVEYNYAISYSGNVPANASLYDLNMVFNCGPQNFGIYTLPKNISTSMQSGTGKTTSNQWSSAKDCNTASVATQGCLAGTSTLTVSGPNMPLQTLSRPTNEVPLPVTLVSFDARKTEGGVFLSWTTANEEAGDRYFVERSTDALNWTSIAMVASAGKGLYDHTDLSLQAGTTYYRLRNIDAKGEVTYSRVLGVKATTEETQIDLYPNPVSGQTLRISGIQTPADWTYTITNSASQVVAHAALAGTEITLPELPAGLYFVRLANPQSGEAKVLKLMRSAQ